MGWQQVMDTRYYLYPLHTSRTFLHTQTLDSALYLVLLRLLNRDYESVFRQITTCAVGVPFTQQEAWIFSQFSRTLDDKHPDAHSCRTKLALAVVYSDNKCKWEMHEELSRERGGTRRRV